jgi:hypothetical protein
MLSVAERNSGVSKGTGVRGTLGEPVESLCGRDPINSALPPACAEASAGAPTPAQVRRSHATAARKRDVPDTATRSPRKPRGRLSWRPSRPWRTAWRCELLISYQLKVRPSAIGTYAEA